VRKKCGNTQCYRCKNKNNGKMCENSQAIYPQEFYETFLSVHKMEYELIKKEWNQAQTKFLELLNGIISDINGRYTEDYRQQQESLKNKRQRILEKFADGIITDEDYKSMREILDKKEKQLVKDIRKIQHGMETDRVQRIEELICREDFCRQLFFMYTMSEIEKIIVQKDALQIVYVNKPKEILIYKHKNQKTLKKEEKREEVYQCIKGGMGTASEIAKKTGLSAGNVLLKMKELKNQGRVVFDGGWKILK
jgi:predicted Rossmann fold nucleotide-binding protein DprA/Smf involved in DNA uptake